MLFATSSGHRGGYLIKVPAFLPPLFQLSHPGGGSIGWLSIIYAVDPLFRISHLELALRGGFSAVSASEWNFCARFFWPFSFIPFCKEPPRSASSIFFVDLLIAVRRVLASIVSGDLRLGQFVNIHASFRTVGQACGVARVAFHLVRPS